MNRVDLERWQHAHDYAVDTSVAERRTRGVIGITVTMLVEIGAGTGRFQDLKETAEGMEPER